MGGRLVVDLPAALQQAVAAGGGTAVLLVDGSRVEPGVVSDVGSTCDVLLTVDLRGPGHGARFRLAQRLSVPDGGSLRFRPLPLP